MLATEKLGSITGRGTRARIVVVGAGLSGLTAAYRLVAGGADVVVLEARDRVGGRVWRLPLAGDVAFNAGGEVADDAHTALLGLANEVGVAMWRAEPWGAHAEPPLDGDDLALFRALESELDALGRRVDPRHPEDADDAERLDRETIAGWLAARGASEHLLAVAETLIAVASSSVPITEMSVLAQAVKLAAGAAPNGLPIRFQGGPTALAEALAARLEGRLRLGAEAVAVEQDRTSARVAVADGSAECAERVVLALPLTLERLLRFDAPPHRRLAYAEARYGDAVKAGLLYEGEPPDESVSADGVFFVPDSGQPVLAFFAGSHAARRLAALDADERRREIARLAGGRPRATGTVTWAEERYTRGSYLILGPGHLTRWGRRLADPHGRVHFAGAEASTLRSYMESAVRAGERAAEEVLEALS